MTKSRGMPTITGGWRRRLSYFTSADAKTIAEKVELPLSHDDGGRAAAEQLNHLARAYLLAQEQATSATDPSIIQVAARLETHAIALLEIFNQPSDGPGPRTPSLDVYRLLAEQIDVDLAQQGRILGRASRQLGGYQDDPLPVVIRSVHYLRAWAAALRQAGISAEPQAREVKKRRTRSPVPGVRQLVEGLETSFIGLFGSRAIIHTSVNGKRCGPAVCFMKAFAALLAERLERRPAKDAGVPEAARRLRQWSTSDGLAEHLIRIQRKRKDRSMVK